MRVLGIDFVPLNVPLIHHVRALSAGIMMFLILGLLPVGHFITIYFLFFSKYWSIFCVYLFWIWVVDRNTAEQGGRPNEWVRSWSLFKYVHDYFPVHLSGVPGFKLDPRRNYMCCTFPHGIMPIGNMVLFFPNACEESHLLFPDHFLRGVTLNANFFAPIYREFLLAIGVCSVSSRSIDWLLSRPEGGTVVGLVVGGAEESLFAQSGQYSLVLKDRKGFIKIALRNGTALIPTFAFGQNDIFKLFVFPEGSIGRRFQNWVKRKTGIAPLFWYGRGLFQYTFGMIPINRPINIVLGMPIEVPKIEHPTQEDIDNLHKIFIDKLTEIYETYKHKYVDNPDDNSKFTIC